MASDRTMVTELATALGMLGHDDLDSLFRQRTDVMCNLTEPIWHQLEAVWRSGVHAESFKSGLANGAAFLAAPDALGGRRPRLIEWTGGRKAPGDEVVPADLRVDHVYLVSCKYLSRILHNLSPSRLIEGLLSRDRPVSRENWYERIAPAEFRALYRTCTTAAGLDADLPDAPGDAGRDQRRRLAYALRGEWPPGAANHYAALCEAVSDRTAELWRSSITPHTRELLSWRLLRIGSAPYFVLGSSSTGSMRLRIATPWDLRQRFTLTDLRITAERGGQPRVRWDIDYLDQDRCEARTVTGHVEIRWSHGRFGQPPEAKVYLDTAPEHVPGYHPLGDEAAQLVFDT